MASWKAVLLLAIGLLLISKPVIAQDDDDSQEEADSLEADVVTLTEKTFDSELKAHKYALVEFYAPWCGHCQQLKPQYAKAATILKGVDEQIMLAKVDATEEKALGQKFEVQGYPTLKWFVDGKLAMEYSGGRDVDAIVRWVKKKTGPATVEVTSEAELEQAGKDNKVIVLGFFDKYEGAEYTEYEAAAQKSDDAAFLKTTDAAVAAKLGLSAPGFALVRNYDDFGVETVLAEGHSSFEGKDLSEKLAAFIKAEKLPAYLEFSAASSSDIFGSGVNHQVIVVASEEQLTKGSGLTVALTEAANKVKGKVIFVTSKQGSEDGKPIADFFGLDKDAKEPQIVGFFTQGGKKYKFGGSAESAAELEEFALAVVDGTAPKTFKSAKEPKSPTDKGVTVIVGNTVDSIVKDPTKDVLLEVYAPWCGHCKQLAPVYEKLAKRFATVDSVVIAKMDGTENEHPDIEAQGFPTLLFFPAEEGSKAIPYDGKRTLAGFTKFLKEHAKVKFQLPKKAKKGKKEKAADEVHEEL